MDILIIQEAGRNEGNKEFREALSLQRALKYHEQNTDVWGLNYPNFRDRPFFDNYDIIINLENYDQSEWVPDLHNYKKPFKMLWCIDAHVKGIKSYREVFEEGDYQIILQANQPYLDKDSVWFPNCFDSDLIKPLYEEDEDLNDFANRKKHEFGFCGSILNRGYILNYLSQYYKMKQDIFVIGKKMVETINSYWLHFNQNIADDVNYRNFETLGCQTALITSYSPQYKELGFKDGENCLIYKDYDELQKKLREFLGNHQYLEYLSINGYKMVKQHTYNQRALELLRIYKEKK